jgi:hypothetical protein
MSKLTFLGWLKLELMRMSESKTVSIHKLATLAQEDNSRLAEPLLAYAMETNAVFRLISYIEDRQLREECRCVLRICNGKSIASLSGRQADELPWSYRKLLDNWRAAEGKPQRVEQSKRMRLDRSLQLMREKGISNAQIYHNLDLNPGNTNAYLKHRDTSKLSLDNATRIMKYLYTVEPVL